ncbi:telomere repeat-binding factor-like [Raphidocelis subcapitata]|uniref:Telomere repeat-binding factor-like n=1 Tax=Raphidocelis subcapitata TaxID=307507 RepID=A0A2V0PLA8_9CHLO|nr:telomere repeat-binding factor-like [Raphidocelis subcapitata]|eukprot:GBF98823.1 telomere repeat-binding factor-like [Raphidocelis subcapitata]
MRDKGRKGDKGARRPRDDEDPDFRLGSGGAAAGAAPPAAARRKAQPPPRGADSGDDTQAGRSPRGARAAEAQPPLPIDEAMIAAAALGDLQDPTVAIPLDPNAVISDPGMLSAIVANGMADAGGPIMLGPDGQPLGAMTLATEDLEQLQGGIFTMDGRGLVPHPLDAHERLQMEGIRKGDMQALQAAKRAGTLITLAFSVELPPELQDVDMGARAGIIEAPASADVSQLKRLFFYAAHNQLLPALQVLVAEDGAEMAERDEGGSPVPISAYGVADGGHVTLRIVIPDDVDDLPLVDEAIASSSYRAVVGHGGSRGGGGGGGRKTRWTPEQIDALVEGVEKHGLSAWRAIVQDPRLGGKNNMQCKDKFRNLCLTIIQGRPERGLSLDWQLKERVRHLIEEEHIRF